MATSVCAVLPSVVMTGLCSSQVALKSKAEVQTQQADLLRESESGFSWADSQKLTQQMSQRACDKQSEILDFSRQLPRAQGIVGDLPADWLMKLKDEEREQNREKVFTAFKNTMGKIRDACHGQVRHLKGALGNILLRSKTADSIEEEPEVADDDLAAVLKPNGVVAQDQPVKFTFVGEGCYGTVHRFNVNQRAYALKLFKQKVTKMGEVDDFHGSPIEQNRAAFVQANIPDNPFVKFYFGDIDSGYMVTDFLEKTDSSSVASNVNSSLSQHGIKYGDLGLNVANMIQGKIVDYGGISVLPQGKTPENQ